MPLSDAELITRVLAGDDRRAFGQLVERHQSAVRGLLRKLTGGDAARADDLAQEAFLRAYRGLGSYRGGAQFSSWMHRVAVNVFLAEARKVKHLPWVEAPMDAGTDRVALRHDLAQALGHLRLEERTALALTFGQELTHEEAAQILDWPLGTLKTHVARGKDRLRELLAEDPPLEEAK